MKKYPFLGLAFVLFGLTSAPAAEVMNPGSKNFNTYGNARAEQATDENRPAVHVTLGGVNNQRGGALQLFLKGQSEPDADCLAVAMRGDGDNGSVVVLIEDAENSWCWNGKRWDSSAAISCANDMPRKRVFKFVDFKRMSGNAEKIDPAKITKIHIGIGPNLNNTAVKAAGYYLYSVALEKDAVDGELPAIPAAPAEAQKKI